MKRLLKWIVLGLIVGLAAFYFWPEKTYKPYAVSADYNAQADVYVVPAMPPDWSWGLYKNGEEPELRFGETGNRDAAKATIIFVPGYTATLDMYGEQFDMLARRGYHVMGLDMRGQGGSERHRPEFPEKLWVGDFENYGDDIRNWLSGMDLPQDRIVILAGSSFGGNTVIRAAGDAPLNIDGLYLLAPAIEPNTGEYSFERAKSMLSRFILIGRGKRYVLGQGDWKPESNDLTTTSNCSSYAKRLHYRDVIFTREPEQRVGGATNKWFYEFLKSSEHMNNQAYLSNIQIPVTVITAEIDDFVSNDVNAKACADYFPNCVEVVIPGTKHCLLQENDVVQMRLYDEFDALFERITSSQY